MKVYKIDVHFSLNKGSFTDCYLVKAKDKVDALVQIDNKYTKVDKKISFKAVELSLNKPYYLGMNI